MADDRVTWIDTTSTSHKLDDILDASSNLLLALQGRTGFGMPPYRRVEQQMPQVDGVRLKAVYANPADMNLPLLIKASSESALYTQMETMAGWFDPKLGDGKLGDGKLRVATPNGNTRQRTCRYVAGLEESDAEGNRGPGWRQVVLAFRATSPYWEDTSASTYDFGSATVTHSITNNGDVVCWPVWTLHGVFTAVTLANTTTGDSLTITKTLTSTQSITITTDPLSPSVVRDDGSNQFSTITSTPPKLWSLAAGANSITVTITGSGTNCDVSVSWTPRYRTL